MGPKVVKPEELYSKDFLDMIQEKLKVAKSKVSEIELSNNKSKRQEWRDLKKYIRWAEDILRTYRKED